MPYRSAYRSTYRRHRRRRRNSHYGVLIALILVIIIAVPVAFHIVFPVRFSVGIKISWYIRSITAVPVRTEKRSILVLRPTAMEAALPSSQSTRCVPIWGWN